jgi:hypothetical protein
MNENSIKSDVAMEASVGIAREFQALIDYLGKRRDPDEDWEGKTFTVDLPVSSYSLRGLARYYGVHECTAKPSPTGMATVISFGQNKQRRIAELQKQIDDLKKQM